jgi:hypothetical protein
LSAMWKGLEGSQAAQGTHLLPPLSEGMQRL